MDLALAIEKVRPGAAYRLSDANAQTIADIIEWRDARPIPTQAELDAAAQAITADQVTDTATRNAIKTAAQSAVGIRFDQLTATQRNALIAANLYRAGALDKNGNVRPLAEWLK